MFATGNALVSARIVKLPSLQHDLLVQMAWDGSMLSVQPNMSMLSVYVVMSIGALCAILCPVQMYHMTKHATHNLIRNICDLHVYACMHSAVADHKGPVSMTDTDRVAYCMSG